MKTLMMHTVLDRSWWRGLSTAFGLTLLVPAMGVADLPNVPDVYRLEARLTAPDVKPGVYAKLYTPSSAEPAPAVVILHGRSGIFPVYHDFAQTLVSHGYIALVLDYYAETGGIPFRSEDYRRALWPTLERTVQQSVRYLLQRADVDANRIGIVGFSQGATLAVSTAGLTPAIKVAVAYYGYAPWTLEERAPKLPPLLILHGEADPWVKADHAHTMHQTLTSIGKTVEMHLYPEASHAFNVHSHFYRPHIAADAEQRTLSFLAQYLQPKKHP